MKKLYIITLFVLLIAGGIPIIERSVSSAQEDANLEHGNAEASAAMLSAEEATFDAAHGSSHLQDSAFGNYHGTDLEAYYARRAYPGAPPAIPHPVENELSMGGNTCLQCHQKGGYVAKFDAFAPVTPHSDKINCRQCHSGTLTEELFRETHWDAHRLANPELGYSALPGSPPPIPHSLSLRGSCLSCHSGPW